jgi:hypothetical protein
MIPRSINKRPSPSIVDEWEVANSKDLKLVEEELECDSDQDSFSEQEYQYLRESVNTLYEEQNNNVEIEEDVGLKYRYDGLSVLKQDLECYFEGIEEIGATPQVHICAYHINEKHKHPFLEYFLFKNTKEKGDSLHFPRFEYTNSVNVVTKGLAVIELLSLSYYKSAKYVFNGYTNDANNLYLFFDCSGLELDGFKMSRMNDLWMVTMDEIINNRKVCNFSIENEVLEFFYNNMDLLFLKDTTGQIYENPTVLYAGSSRKELDFKTTFGISSSGNGSLMGNYYYFTDYQNAVKNAGWLNESMGCGGLIRCAIFLGKMKVLLNNPDDNVDESNFTKEILLTNNENSVEYKNVRLLMRISDRDGMWTENYDSVYLGKMDLDDGSVFNEYPLWVVKSYEQQVVLSSHIIDKKTLDDEWRRDSEYFVL